MDMCVKYCAREHDICVGWCEMLCLCVEALIFIQFLSEILDLRGVVQFLTEPNLQLLHKLCDSHIS